VTDSAPSSWRDSRIKRIEAALISATGYYLVNAIGKTLRWHTDGTHHYKWIQTRGQQPILCLWHGRIFPAIYFLRDRGIVVITSQNFDGEWIAGILARMGYGTARGSSSRGAVKALVQLKRDLAHGKPVAFTVDGPRGPARISQPGAIWLAKATGNPLLPFHVEADRYWTLKSWDRTQIAKPWANAAFVMGEPLYVEPDADEAGLEEARAKLDAALLGLEMRALAMLQDG